MVFRSRVILAVGAHPDDIELGCGGTLCRAAELGARVIAVFLTRGSLVVMRRLGCEKVEMH